MIADQPFQSTPDLVNRENGFIGCYLRKLILFQSTPDLVNRENILCARGIDVATGFQSTPDLVNRENRRYYYIQQSS